MGDDALARRAEHLRDTAAFAAEWHMAAVGWWSHFQMWPGVIAAALASAASATAFKEQTTVAGILGLLSAVTASALATLRPHERADRHLRAAADYRELALKFEQLGRDLSSAPPASDGGQRLKELELEYAKVDRRSPWAQRHLERKAKDFIDRGERYFGNDGATSRPPQRRRWLPRRERSQSTP